MEANQIVDSTSSIEEIVMESGHDQFIQANTLAISTTELRNSCIIPSFAKDNESTISHTHFIEGVYNAAQSWFKGESILEPSIRVSHPVKGRIPSAMGKPAKFLQEDEKTLYFERMAFIMEVPTIRDTVNGNELALTIGGVRAYNLENLYSKKVEEKFKVCIGFKNRVCTNLCISTDGLLGELRARTVAEIADQAFRLFTGFDAPLQLNRMSEFGNEFITEQQFAQLVGRSKMYNYLPPKQKKEIPGTMPLVDSQISLITKAYYQDENFCRSEFGGLSLWRLYNLFTGANKSSYIDTFLDRGAGALDFIEGLQTALKTGSSHWFLS